MSLEEDTKLQMGMQPNRIDYNLWDPEQKSQPSCAWTSDPQKL